MGEDMDSLRRRTATSSIMCSSSCSFHSLAWLVSIVFSAAGSSLCVGNAARTSGFCDARSFAEPDNETRSAFFFSSNFSSSSANKPNIEIFRGHLSGAAPIVDGVASDARRAREDAASRSTSIASATGSEEIWAPGREKGTGKKSVNKNLHKKFLTRIANLQVRTTPPSTGLRLVAC